MAVTPFFLSLSTEHVVRDVTELIQIRIRQMQILM